MQSNDHGANLSFVLRKIALDKKILRSKLLHLAMMT